MERFTAFIYEVKVKLEHVCKGVRAGRSDPDTADRVSQTQYNF